MLPKKLLIVDLETTGLNPEIDEVIELGAILYSVPHHCILQQFSTVFPVTHNPAESVNHISLSASQAISDFQWVIERFQLWVQEADYLVAHNARFDSQWFGRGFLPSVNKPWLCTYRDFVWQNNTYPTNLTATCLNHEIQVGQAHRALSDCQMIAALLDYTASQNDGKLDTLLQRAIRRSLEMTVKIKAIVNYDSRELAKKHNFWWDSVNRYWYKELKISDSNREIQTYSFDVEILGHF